MLDKNQRDDDYSLSSSEDETPQETEAQLLLKGHIQQKKKAKKIDQFTPAPYVPRIIKKSFLQLFELCIISTVNKLFGIKINPNYVLSINSPRKIYWDLFVMLLATYNCF